MTAQDAKAYMKKERICVIIPTYNNDKTVSRIVDEVCQYADSVIVVNDGSTDNTALMLLERAHNITFLSYEENKGKGHALQTGFREALQQGMRYAITIDSDGQHYPSDIPLLLEAHARNPKAIIVGARTLTADNMPRGNTFANLFSNFWYFMQTFHRLNDTQSGFRLYPLQSLPSEANMHVGYEFELATLVYANWKGVPAVTQPIHIYYPPEGERVSHFRPIKDFGIIALLNTWLCLQAYCYRLPAKLLRKLCS